MRIWILQKCCVGGKMLCIGEKEGPYINLKAFSKRLDCRIIALSVTLLLKHRFTSELTRTYHSSD
jgi:hypothetical protein